MDRRLREYFDWPLVGTVMSILALGLVNLYSATVTPGTAADRLFWLQCGYSVLGILIMLGTATLLDYRVLERLAYGIYALALGLLLLVKAIGVARGGAQGWISLGPVNFQPVEFTKIAIVVVLAKWFHDHPRLNGYRLWELIIPGVFILIPAVLLILEPDMGGAGLIILLSLAIFLFVRIETWTLVAGGALGAITAPLMYFFVLQPYQQARIQLVFNPGMDPKGRGYNSIMSKMAIGAGELFGRGYLNGTQSKLKFLPAHHTDFIFSVLAEEWGFVGCCVTLGMLFLLLFLGLRIAGRSKERFGVLLAFGLVAMFFWQVFVNVGGALGLIPETGVTLPFLSYGGSSLLINFAAIGLLLNVGMRRFMF